MSRQKSISPKKRKSRVHRSSVGMQFSLGSSKNHVVYRNKGNTGEWCFEILDKGDNGAFRFDFPVWEKARMRQKRLTHMLALLSLHDHTVAAFSINFSRSTELAIRKQQNLSYPRDTIRDVIKSELGSEHPIFFYAIAELSKAGRLHLHGALAISNNCAPQERLESIFPAIRARLAKKYRQIYRNTAVHYTTEWRRKHRTLDDNNILQVIENIVPIGVGWHHYCEKDDREIVNSNTLRNDIIVSEELKQASRLLWDTIRARGVRQSAKIAKQGENTQGAGSLCLSPDDISPGLSQIDEDLLDDLLELPVS